MRTDGEFLQDLRAEIQAQQGRRAELVLRKISFGLGLLGVGSISIGQVTTYYLLYLVPVVVIIFDLYTLGEDFAIKRAGRFLALSPMAPVEERCWEMSVQSHRDRYSRLAGPLASLLAVVAAAALLFLGHVEGSLYGAWVLLSILTIVLVWVLGIWRTHALGGFEETTRGCRATLLPEEVNQKLEMDKNRPSG